MNNDKRFGYEKHMFVCTNVKPSGECCGLKNANQLRDSLKKIARDKYGLKVRINASGCLGYCEEGIAAVLYPECQWFTGLDSEDTSLLEEALEKSFNSPKTR